MALVIKKTVDLGTLGDEYKGITLTFKSIPVKDLPELAKRQEEAGEDTGKALPLLVEILEKQFLDGKQDDNDLTKEDIKELDSDALVSCFQILTGQATDPKVPSESSSTSSTDTAKAQK